MTDALTISGAPAVEVTIETAPTVAVELSAGAQVDVTLQTGPTVEVTLQTAPTVEVTLETGPTVEVELQGGPTLLFVPDGKLEGYATQAELAAGLAGKSDAGHDHDGRYYTEDEADALLAGKSNTDHDHDGRYYTEDETYTKGETDALFTAFRAALLNAVYPVGAIYLSTVSTSPATLFGGTWTRITGRFLLAATDGGSSGASQAAGNTGGAATVTLTANQSGQRALTISGGGHTHTVSSNVGALYATGSSRNGYNAGGTSSGNLTPGIAANTGTHSHTVSAANATEAHNNMPPWLAVYVWKRTA